MGQTRKWNFLQPFFKNFLPQLSLQNFPEIAGSEIKSHELIAFQNHFDFLRKLFGKVIFTDKQLCYWKGCNPEKKQWYPGSRYWDYQENLLVPVRVLFLRQPTGKLLKTCGVFKQNSLRLLLVSLTVFKMLYPSQSFFFTFSKELLSGVLKFYQLERTGNLLYYLFFVYKNLMKRNLLQLAVKTFCSSKLNFGSL